MVMEHVGRLRARVAGIALALVLGVLASLAGAPAALADEGVTYTIGGLSYTLPSDWEATEDADEIVAELEESGLDVREVVAYQKDDGVFAALSFAEDSAAGATLEEAQESVEAIAESLALTPLSSIEVSAAMEQGCPTMTFYTEDIVLNDVTYALTAKVYAVDNAELTGGVAMIAFLPASGVTTDGFEDSFPVTTADTTVTLGGMSYVVPAGVRLAQGSMFGCDFVLGEVEDDVSEVGAAVIALGFDFEGASSLFTLDELQEMADSLMSGYAESGQASGIDSLWAGATTIDGYAMLAVEALVSSDVLTDSADLAFMVTFTDDGLSALLVAQGEGETLAESVVGSAAAVTPRADAEAGSGMTGAAADSDSRGFVVGVE